MDIMQDESQEDLDAKIENNDEDNVLKKNKPTQQKIVGRFSTTALVGIVVVTIFISSFFGALFGFMSGGVASIFSAKIGQKLEQYFPGLRQKTVDPQVSKQQILVEDSAVIDVVEKSSPSVVSIVISKNIPSGQGAVDNPGSFFDPFFGMPGDPFGTLPPDGSSGGSQQIGGGTGFFISADGMILTNRHVVEDSTADYTVVTSDGQKLPAKVLGSDPVRDIAIIKVDGNNFPVVPLGDSDTLKIGQTAIAIGNSLGEFSNSVSRGIVSGLKRNVNAGSGFGDTERLTDIIQTDAAINLGNSGGPLLDIDGNVIGINVARAQGAENVGFALPINQAKRIIDQVKNGTKISVPFLGVRYIVIDSVVQKEAQLPFDYGVLVLRGNKMTDLAVIPGSPADKVGIVENDIILEIDGVKLTQDNQLGDVVAKHIAGDVITLKVWHKGSEKDVQVTLEETKQ